MVRSLVRIIVFFVSAAIGLLAAGWLVPGFTLRATGFILAVVVFAIVQSLLTPISRRIADKNAPALLGIMGLVSTLVALLITAFIPGGIHIEGLTGWVGGALVVWIVTALGSFLLPYLLIRDKKQPRGSGGDV